MTDKILAWHGDPDLKENTLLRMKDHAEQDRFIRMAYIDTPNSAQWRGCLHGCLSVENMAADMGLTVKQVQEKWWDGEWADVGDSFGGGIVSVWHNATERYFGIPVELGREMDYLYEKTKDIPPAEVAVQLLEAIPVGADLSGITISLGSAVLADLPDALEILRNAPVPGQEEDK